MEEKRGEGEAMKKIISYRVIVTGMLTAVLLTGMACILYGMYANYVSEVASQSTESAKEEMTVENPSVDQLEELFRFQYILYKDLFSTRLMKMGENEYIRYQDLYFEKGTAEEGFPEFLAYLRYLEDPDSLEDETVRYDMRTEYEQQVYAVKEGLAQRLSYLEEYSFSGFNEQYDYWIQSTEKGSEDLLLTNTQTAEQKPEEYAYLYRIVYDEFGVPSISDFLYAADEEKMRKDINSILHENPVIFMLGENFVDKTQDSAMYEAVMKETKFRNPVNCCITIGMTKAKWEQRYPTDSRKETYHKYYKYFDLYEVNLTFYGLVFLAGALGAVYLNPRSETKSEVRRIPRIPLEILLLLGGVTIAFFGVEKYYYYMAVFYLGRYGYLLRVLGSLSVLYLAFWYFGGCLGEIRTLGFGEYMDRRCLIVRNLNGIKEWTGRLVQSYREIDLSGDLRKKLLLIIIENGVLLVLMCCGWFLGAVGVLIYSAALYFLALKHLSRIQKEYRLLHRMTGEMAAGNLKYEPTDSMGVFEPLKKDLVSIRGGFDAAVQEEVKSQRMKTELITNVSHDLKTPLTAIITYINLLQEKDLTQEQQSAYLSTLEKKSLRLKTLIEDLFEISKANSGNVQLNLQSCDLVNLLKQVALEMQDKLEEKHLAVRLLLPEEKVVLQLDSEKTYRIYENLFGNVAKYAMEETRVYVELIQSEEQVSVVIKNITEAEILVSPEELTERFVRGDVSRGSVEGSGLGLAIVRRFTELQGGKLEIGIDGDLFKVTTCWKRKDQPVEGAGGCAAEGSAAGAVPE